MGRLTFRGQRIARLRQLGLLQHPGLVARQRNALIELAVDLPAQLAHRPAAAQCLGFVEVAGLRSLHRQKPNIGGPR